MPFIYKNNKHILYKYTEKCDRRADKEITKERNELNREKKRTENRIETNPT